MVTVTTANSGVRTNNSNVWRFHRGKAIAAKGKPSRGDETRFRSSTYRARIVLRLAATTSSYRKVYVDCQEAALLDVDV